MSTVRKVKDTRFKVHGTKYWVQQHDYAYLRSNTQAESERFQRELNMTQEGRRHPKGLSSKVGQRRLFA